MHAIHSLQIHDAVWVWNASNASTAYIITAFAAFVFGALLVYMTFT